MGDLGTRVATAAVLVPIVLAALFWDPTPWGLLTLACLVATIGYDEFLRMALPVRAAGQGRSLRILAAGTALGTVLAVGLWGPGVALPPAVTVSVLLLAIGVLARKQHLGDAGRHLPAVWAGYVYVPVLVSVLPRIKAELLPDGARWLTVTLCVAFFSDTVAYGCGRAFGRHKLYPAVSPKKTWEGSLGGVAGGVLATTWVGTAWLLPDLPPMHAVILGVLGSIAGQLGDLVESMFKRAYGVKDSGTLLPGHGGVLDRCDALLFVAPLVYYYATRVLGLGA